MNEKYGPRLMIRVDDLTRSNCQRFQLGSLIDLQHFPLWIWQFRHREQRIEMGFDSLSNLYFPILCADRPPALLSWDQERGYDSQSILDQLLMMER